MMLSELSWGRDGKAILFRAEQPTYSLCVGYLLLINHHSLQCEASPMNNRRCINLQISTNIRKQFETISTYQTGGSVSFLRCKTSSTMGSWSGLQHQFCIPFFEMGFNSTIKWVIIPRTSVPLLYQWKYITRLRLMILITHKVYS